MNHSTTFPVVINRLLAAEVICESSTKGEEFLLLKTEAFFNEVDRYLNKINLKLLQTAVVFMQLILMLVVMK